MTGTSATLTVSRTLEADIGIRDVYIYLDGQMIATLKHKQSATREVTAGHHTIRAHNTFAGKTLEFEAQPGEQIRFRVSNRSGCASSLILILGAGPIYLSFEREDDGPAARPQG